MEALAWMSFPINKLAQHVANFPKGEERDWFRIIENCGV